MIRQFATCGAFLLGLMSNASPCLAAIPLDDAARAAARNAGYEGVHAFQAGDYRTATDKLARAYGVVQVPTLGLWYARALAKSGLLVEAAERYREVQRLEITEGKIKEQQAAQQEARVELESLLPTIPTITVTVSSVHPDFHVTLDGQPFSPSLLGLKTPVNPGEHVVRAAHGDASTEERVTVTSGESRSMTLTLVAAQEPATVPATTQTSSRSSSAARPMSNIERFAEKPASASPIRTVGWAGIGLGIAGTVVGTVAGGLVLSKQRTLEASENCEGTQCLHTEHDQLSHYNRLRTVSSVSFIVGAAGLATGVTLLLLAPKPEQPQLSAWLGYNAVGVGGTFQ